MSGGAEWWLARLLKIGEWTDRDIETGKVHVVNGDVCEMIACYDTRALAERALTREASRQSARRFKVVLNADIDDVVGQVLA